MPSTTNSTTNTNTQVIVAELIRNESCIQLMKYSGREKGKDFGAEEGEELIWFGHFVLQKLSIEIKDSGGGKIAMLCNLECLNSIFPV